MRIIHFLVIGVLVFAAAYVYRIKMESTSRVERVLRLNAEIREQRDAIAALRAEWAKLDAPLRLQGLTERHLKLQPLAASQYDQLKNLPERPPAFARPGAPDPIGAMIDTIEAAEWHHDSVAAGKANDFGSNKSVTTGLYNYTRANRHGMNRAGDFDHQAAHTHDAAIYVDTVDVADLVR